MRQISRFKIVLSLTCLSLCLVSELQAQSSTKQGSRQPAVQQPAGNKPSKPSANDDDPPKRAIAAPKKVVELPIDKDLEEILIRWEEESAKIKTLYGMQKRSEFNHTHAVEKVTEGRFFLETPDKGRIDMMSVKLKKDAVSRKKDKDGKPYRLATADSQRWICTGEDILAINDEEKTYNREEIPASQRGKNIVESPLPFLFGMKAEDAKRRFQLSIVADSNTDESVMLLAIPRMEKDRQNYIKAAITLDKKRYLPIQVRMLDQSKMEIVYTFEGVKVNDKNIKKSIGEFFGVKDDPYHPNLKGFTLVIPTDEPVEVNHAVNNVYTGQPKVPNGKDKKTSNGKDVGKPEIRQAQGTNGSSSSSDKK